MLARYCPVGLNDFGDNDITQKPLSVLQVTHFN